MKKLIYVEENFISPSECQELIDLSKSNKEEVPYGDVSRGGDTFLTHLDGIYLDKTENNIVDKVTNLCKTFDDRVLLDYAGIIRWPVGTFMKPHTDPSRPDQNEDLFAAVLYLNDDFSGGYTAFEEYEIKPEVGKLLVFSNTLYLHHVTKVESAERFVLSVWYNQV